MNRIVIVGGGTSGWLTAAYLAAKLGDTSGQKLHISLIESSDIPTIGVGEATTPSIRATLADIGFDENEFMRACNATFKHGILFRNWTHAPNEDPDDEYFHPFERPLRAGTDGLESYWLRGLDPLKRKFEDSVSIQHQLARLNLAPKSAKDRSYDSPIPYAYHLDAGLLAEALKKLAKSRGVIHIVDKVLNVSCDDKDDICALQLESGKNVEGNFFIDCSGFASLLIEKHFKQDFKDCSDVLFCDSAVTMQITNKPEQNIPPYTHSTATPNGWIWDIALSNRRGTGYVYSSKYTSKSEAEAELSGYIGAEAVTQPMRHLSFKVGYRPTQWYKNCVAVGLSGGFIEPLESTGIHLVEQAIWSLASMLPRYLNGLSVQTQFNKIMSNHYEMAINFVKYHYILSQRKDSKFWLDNVNPSSWTPWLRERVEVWQGSYPDIYDLEYLHSIFDHASYQYVYFGMHGRPKIHSVGGRRDTFATKIFERVSNGLLNAKSRLPDHTACLADIHRLDNGSLTAKSAESLATVNASIRNLPNNYK